MKAIAVDGKLLLANGKAVQSPVEGGVSLDLGLTGATVGQIAKIASVDEDGSPTSWESTDLPSGGGSSGSADHIVLNLSQDESKIPTSELQLPCIGDKTVDEVMEEVNAGKKYLQIYLDGEGPITMNLTATYPKLSFAFLVGGEEIEG